MSGHMSQNVLSPRRTNLKGQQAQEQILAAAIKLFAERGYAGTSLSELAAEANVAKPSLLYHYPDKDSMWTAAVEHLWSMVDSFFQERWPRSTPPSRELLEEILALFVEAGVTWPAYIRIPFIEGATPSWRSEWLVDRHFGQHVRITDRIVRALQQRGELRAGDSAFLQALLTSAINTMIAQAAMWERAYGRSFLTRERLLELAALTLDCLFVPKVDRSVK
jgi:AcrR family transcriptional regulator